MKRKSYRRTIFERILKKEPSDIDFDAGEVVEDFLWVGSIHAAHNEEELRIRGITSIVTVARGLDMRINTDEFEHKVISLVDHPAEDLLGKLEEGVKFLVDQEKAQKKVLVHCAAGVSRSVSLCVAYLMIQKRWTQKVALEVIRLNRPFANPNIGFTVQLAELDSCNGNILLARENYQQRLGKRSVVEVLFTARNKGKELYAKIDSLELEAKQKSIKLKRNELEQIKKEAEQTLNDNEVPDRVANLILNSIIKKTVEMLGGITE